MNGQSLEVSLPGVAFQRGQRWWWRVKLPGENEPKARALKPKGQNSATKDREIAAQVAFELWEEAVREGATTRIKMDADAKIARMKAKFLQKIDDVSRIVDRVPNRDAAKVEAPVAEDVHLTAIFWSGEPTGICDCCGSQRVSLASLQPIDSGQLLCPACWEELKVATNAKEVHESGKVVSEP
jgi:hypothetical protein